jgi:tRNA(Met) C34 N-acetyltransferase TmcA
VKKKATQKKKKSPKRKKVPKKKKTPVKKKQQKAASAPQPRVVRSLSQFLNTQLTAQVNDS